MATFTVIHSDKIADNPQVEDDPLALLITYRSEETVLVDLVKRWIKTYTKPQSKPRVFQCILYDL